MREPLKTTGLAVNAEGHVLVGLPTGTIAFGLSPTELRSFAARLIASADEIEAGAAAAASAALAKAGGLQ